MKYTRKDKERVRKTVNLDTSPDDEFMGLLARANGAAENPRPAGATALRTTPAELETAGQIATGRILQRAK